MTDDSDDDVIVLPESAVDDALDTVRTGAGEYEDDVYAVGVIKGAEQMHRLLTSLDLSDDD